MLKRKWVLLCSLLPCVLFAQIRINSRTVEVYVSVADSKGKPVKTLQVEDFRVFEDGREQEVRIFEPASTGITLALLIDTTASVAPDLPHVKNAVGRLLGVLRSDDSVGLFTFATSLTPLSEFTTDRKKTLGAVLQTRAAGETALFDSLAQLSRSLSKMAGKKAILLFTDGDDTSSILSFENSIDETRRVGIPIYAMIYGRALGDPSLLKRLENISKASGATSFRVRQPSDLPLAFQSVAEDLQDQYLLGYQFNGDPKKDFHSLKVELTKQQKLNVDLKKPGYWQ
jgi:Ca-activated chloride channel family protein